MAKEFRARAYQEYVIGRIIGTPAIGLMLDMGLGKTVCTLTAVSELMHEYFDVEKVLVVAPKRVAENTWMDERDEWEHLEHLKLSLVLGNAAERAAALAREADIYITNRENVVWLVEYCGRKWPFDMVVIDESSSFKSHQAKRFKALKKVRPFFRRIVELTGTPAPNGLLDLWSQVYLLDGGERLGRTITAYRDKYFRPGQRNGNIVYSYALKSPKAEKEIYEKISDICISMKSEEYLQLPEKIYSEFKVTMTDEAGKRYRELEKELILSVGEQEISASTAAVLSNKLLQMANGAVYDEGKEVVHIHDEKIHALAEIREFSEGKNMLVMYQYQHDRIRLKEAFANARELKTSGDMHDWNQGKIKMALLHPASAGHGLNLQHGGNIVVWFGLTWSLELYLQANKRLHRPGQKETVLIYHIISRGTVDEDVMEALKAKNVGQEGMMEAVRARIEKYRKAE